jgi:hypothetical protein
MMMKLNHLKNGTMPTVVCPKHTCGCGLCAPKSMDKDKYQEVLFRHVDKEVFRNSMTEEVSLPKEKVIWIK